MSNNVLPRHGIANFLRLNLRLKNLLNKIYCDSAYPPYSEFLYFGNTCLCIVLQISVREATRVARFNLRNRVSRATRGRKVSELEIHAMPL